MADPCKYHGLCLKRRWMTNYNPRPVFMPFHMRSNRWACIVAHRRAGKTVACINEVITRALACKKNRPQYAYIAPLFVQAKQIAWEYLKEYASAVIERKNESELYIELVNGARIFVLGADNPDRLRGLYLDGVILDEFGDMRPRLFPEVIRPALADRKGWAVFIGTPKGENAFYDIYQVSKTDNSWFSMMLKASESGLLDLKEIEDMRKTMSEDQAAQELECSFSAAIQGAVYAKWIDENKCRDDIYDPDLPVHTAWDLGFDDSTAIWFWQVAGNEVRVIDCYENNGQDIIHYCDTLKNKPYKYGDHYAPHDAANKLLAAGGRSIVQQAWEQGIKMRVVAATSQQNQIEATRAILKKTWFDHTAVKDGLRALRQYQFEFDESKKTYRSTPRHDWTSHYADAFEIIGQAMREVVPLPQKSAPKFLQQVTAHELFWGDIGHGSGNQRI